MTPTQEPSKEKLVIMVIHNPELAREYADRIIGFSDGQIQHGSRPHIEHEEKKPFELKRTKMKFVTALCLSSSNIRTEEGRTSLTAFVSNTGITSITIVLSLSTGFQEQADRTQPETLAQFPITISKIATDQDPESFNNQDKKGTSPKEREMTAKISDAGCAQHTNLIDQESIDYINHTNPESSNNIGYTRLVNMNLLGEINGGAQTVKFSNNVPDGQSSAMASMMTAQTGIGVPVFPKQLENGKDNFLKDNYSLPEGNYPEKKTDVVLIVDSNNTTNINALKNLGSDAKDNQKIAFLDIADTKMKLANNNAFYTKLSTDSFIPNQDLQAVYDNPENTGLTISGILRIKDPSTMNLSAPGIAYSDALSTNMITKNKTSDVVKAQEASNTNVTTNGALNASAEESLLPYLGMNEIPSSIMIYLNGFKSKDKIPDYLGVYNEGKNKKD